MPSPGEKKRFCEVKPCQAMVKGSAEKKYGGDIRALHTSLESSVRSPMSPREVLTGSETTRKNRAQNERPSLDIALSVALFKQGR